jgi:acyl-CoA reductase-like NAD-dependent aldehyde dehydrogenase
MQIAEEELLAPVALFMTVQSVDEANEATDSAIYGLDGAIFGSNRKDVEKVINEVETVGIAVYDFAVFYVCQLPFGRTKGSRYR